ncbi:MAG TPA: Smr/MutS family protein [Myxococcota bacterium]|nr:Smr/MutS family protein [Myxococcota bacterium]
MARDPDDDDALFAEAVAGVVRLEQTRRAPTPVYRDPVPLSEREREVIRELDALVSGESPFDPRHSEEFQNGCVPGLDPRVLRRLRKGEFTPQADLDLHGCDAATARRLVEEFVVAAHARGLRCLRIVHGRGNRSPNGEPVLRPSLPRWLARGPARWIVLAYTSAPPTDGGTGATYVLLRRGRAL